MKAAMLLGGHDYEVSMMGEAGRDPLGDLLVKTLEEAGVDTSCIDRYSDGASTPSILMFPSEQPGEPAHSIVYRVDMAERWDSRWPRVDAGDIVVFGGYFALQSRVRPLLVDFIENARQRKALIVNMPGFNPVLAPAVTRVMPALLENLEKSDVVMTATPDLKHIFHTADAERCYRDKIKFYAPMMFNFDPISGCVTLMRGSETVTAQGEPEMHSDYPVLSGRTLAAVVKSVADTELNSASIAALPPALLQHIADTATNIYFSSNQSN